MGKDFTTEMFQSLSFDEQASLVMGELLSTEMEVVMLLHSNGVGIDQVTGLALINLGLKMAAKGDGAFRASDILMVLRRLPETFSVHRGELTAEQAEANWAHREKQAEKRKANQS